MGIDLYWDKTFFKQQQHVFDFQLSFAKENKLPVIINARNSLDEIIDVMKPHFNSDLTGVFHCFPGNSEQAKLVIDKGFYIGIGGVLTYKKSNMPEVVRNIPLESILLETDAPYLSPVPKRGKRNEPSYVSYVAEYLSGLIDCDFDLVCSKTTQNAKDLFNL
ncbi:MAG: hypothetical protein C0596_07125 [Marinilabiliales bacterium]|nr:MAG: hypothetical protein C0596_07125 [Marinilabiliales bacterium]